MTTATLKIRSLLIALALALPASVSLWPSVPSFADDSNIKVVQVGAENHYPQGIRFFVTAGSAEGIDEIRLFFRKTGRVSAGAYRSLDFDPGDVVDAESILSTAGVLNYMPPGTEITYYFEIWDDAGAVHRTPDQKIVYSDARFEWQTLSSGPIIVYYYGEGAEERAQMVLDAATEAIERMAPVLGFEPSEPMRIVSYATVDDMTTALPLRQQLIAGHIQTEGMAFADERVIILRGFDPRVRGITSHEITHLAVGEVSGRAKSRIPTWLDEGLAEYGNIEPTVAYENALRLAIALETIRPLWTLANFGTNASTIMASYGQSRSVVGYLINTYGKASIAELMKAIRGTLTIDDALKKVYRLDQWGLDSKWRKSMGLAPLPRPEEQQPSLPPSPTPTPTPTPTLTPAPTPVPPTSTPSPTATPKPSPTFTPSPTPVPPTATAQPSATPAPTAVAFVEDDSSDGPGGGCSGAPAGQSGALGGDPALIAILAAPLAMLVFRGRRRP